ncbi:hypothetical protein COOONC_23615, partial [Cooperia oncophora]
LISLQDLVAKSDDVTRSTVQKSVCVLSRAPLFGALKAKLELITRAYFAERDFRKVEVLSQMYSNLCDMFNGETVDGQATCIGEKRLRKLSIAFNNRDGIMNFRYLSAGPFRPVSSSNTHFVQAVTTRKKG